MAVVAGFRCDVVGCKLARRRVRGGAADISGSGGVQRARAMQRGRSDVGPGSTAVFQFVTNDKLSPRGRRDDMRRRWQLDYSVGS